MKRRSASWAKRNLPGAAIRTIYALSLLAATYNHIAAIARHGIDQDYRGVPWPSAAFWSSLSVIDPAAALLLFVRPRIGAAATAIIIVDVVHNLQITARYDPPPFLHAVLVSAPTVDRFVFMVFAILTFPLAWRTHDRR